MISIDERTGSKAYQAAWYQANKERVRLREKARREANPDVVARLTAASKRRYWANPEKAHAQRKANRQRPGDRQRMKEAEDRYLAKPGKHEHRLKVISEYHKNNKQKSRERYVKTAYDLTPIQYRSMICKQQNLCAICDQPETKTWKGQLLPLHVDHDHSTGKVRGLLCFTCNAGLGLFKDNTDFLAMAIVYLERAQ